jgi:hypothetical protein
MKSLNDSLREEFASIINEAEFQEFIQAKNLDKFIINRAFSKLLENKSGADVSDLVRKGRAEFETYIINTLRSNSQQYDN